MSTSNFIVKTAVNQQSAASLQIVLFWAEGVVDRTVHHTISPFIYLRKAIVLLTLVAGKLLLALLVYLHCLRIKQNKTNSSFNIIESNTARTMSCLLHVECFTLILALSYN